ncbi:hypothetical protein N7462_008414 [Penicillium macrosclerotiorum]|uniref:uncharacterized protein n=1 Tax=Penicillium macrosclerotiorum TaxID=303699 RepID=UPI002548750D|nr:uncharacterized protein N7462_008414 [Penicillium macrosclerotiorum]KAJ5675517.1 hypothetical protein N7462_008414 [Penicillium macrosclerotiorum]
MPTPVPPHPRVVRPGGARRAAPRPVQPQAPYEIRNTKEYKVAARRWLSGIVALPVALFTTWILYERGEYFLFLSQWQYLLDVEGCPCKAIMLTLSSLHGLVYGSQSVKRLSDKRQTKQEEQVPSSSSEQ